MNSRTMAINHGTPDHQVSDRFPRSDNQRMPSLCQLNDSVYEFYSPPERMTFSLEIIFFHGLERGDCRKAYMEAWTSILETTIICWPITLLAKEFRRARILSVSYDSSMERGPKHGNLDLYLTAENLVQDLLDDAKVAANLGLPVILVGKDFGGLVIKAICMEAKAKKKSTFLSNLKGIFYYGTPHVGIENLPTAFNGVLAERLMFGDKEIARLGFNFSNYRKKRKWATRAIISRQEGEKMPELVISESSQRYDVDECYTPNEDIDTVCKSQTGSSSSFKFLAGFISHIESVELKLKNSPDQGQREQGFKTLLGFGNDGSYVPMEKTLAKVKNALQEARIVVLHGGPGSGKSSLARYLSLQFEAAAQQQRTVLATSSSAEQSEWLPNGVVYMTCGSGAEITSMQRELLRKFDIEIPLLQDKSEALEGAAELQKMLRQELVEHLLKLQSRVIVVLDDVWDRVLLENLLVPGDRVRYLLTTQISTLWNAHDSKRVRMQDVTQEDARHILGNYANFKDGVISNDLKYIGDEIIVATGSHPLALATLGIVLDNMGRTVNDWQAVKGNLKEHLKTKDYPPSSFGQNYPLSVDASMMVVLDLLDKDEKKLLYIITLFNGPLILETLLQLFLTYALPRDDKINIDKSKMSLVAKGLVRIERDTFGETVTNPKSRAGGDDMRFIWIHSLRQHFILTTKKEEICRITEFLDNDFDHGLLHPEERSNLDLAIALCALYGATDIKRRASQKMSSYFIQRHSRQLAATLKPIVSLMLSEGHAKSPISQAAVEVFLRYVWKHQLDDNNICYLLKLTSYPSVPLATLRALAGIFELELYALEEGKLIDEDQLRFVGVILSLLNSRDDTHRRILDETASETPQIQLCASKALDNICAKASREKSTDVVLNVPDVVTVLVDMIEAALQAEPAEQSSQLAAQAAGILVHLSCGASIDAKLQICKTEGLLAGLVRSLSADDNHRLQKWAALALGNLGVRNADTKLMICDTDGALAGLIMSLSVRDNPALQTYAAWALATVASREVDTTLKISNAEGAVAGLIKSLSAHDNHALQKHAARALQNLAYGDYNILKICHEEGALAGLITSLSAYDNHALQEHAAKALQNLARGDVDIKLKICNEEGALSSLVRSLSEHDNPPLQERAAGTLQNLTLEVASARKVCDEPGSLASLVQSLSAHQNPALQIATAFTLASLALRGGDVKLKVCHEEGALSGLVKLLFQEENTDVHEAVAWALANLTLEDETVQLKVANQKGAIEGLLRAISQHDKPVLQEKAMWALNFLAMVAGESIKLKTAEEEGAVARLLKLSKDKNPKLREPATSLVQTLRLGGIQHRWMNLHFSTCVCFDQ